MTNDIDDVTIICDVTADHLSVVVDFMKSGIIRNPAGEEISGLGASLSVSKSLEAFGIHLGGLNLGLQAGDCPEAVEDIELKTEDIEITDDKLFDLDESLVLPKRLFGDLI